MLSVKSVIENFIKKYKIEIVAGAKGLSREVGWVHLIEDITITSFLKGRELIVMTGISVKDNENALYDLIVSNHRYNSSATIINIGGYIKHLDQRIIDYCDANDYPLMTVPWEIRLPDLTRDFMGKILSIENRTILFEQLMEKLKTGTEDEGDLKQLKDEFSISNQGIFRAAFIGGNKKFLSVRNELMALAEEGFLSESHKYIGFFEDRIILVCYPFDEKSFDEQMEWLRSQIQLKYEDVYLGSGRSGRHLSGLKKTIQQAEEALRLNMEYQYGNYAIPYDQNTDLVYQLLSSQPSHRIKRLTEVIQPIIQQDAQEKTELLRVLETWLENSGSVLKASEALYVHRNTVNYNMAKIRNLLGIRAFSAGDIVNLMVAIKLNKYMDLG